MTELLLSLHQMGAAFFSVAEFELDPKEAEKLSKSIQEVGKHYAVAFDPKKVAIAQLMVVAGGIYGTRLVSWRMRKRLEAKEKVVTMPSRNEPAPATAARPQPVPATAAPRSQPARPQSPSELWPESGVVFGPLY